MQRACTNTFPHQGGDTVVEGLYFSFYCLLKGEWREFHWASSRKRVKGKLQPLIPGNTVKSTNNALQIIKVSSNYIHLLPLELLTDRCARGTAGWPLTEMFSFLAFVTLWICLWQDHGKGFFRVPILIVSLQLYTPQNSWLSNISSLFAQITMCPYQISHVNHLCCGFVEQLPITHLPSQIPVLYWFQQQSHSLSCSGGEGMFFPRPELKRASEWEQHNFPPIDNPRKITEQALGVKNSFSWCAGPLQMVLVRVRTYRITWEDKLKIDLTLSKEVTCKGPCWDLQVSSGRNPGWAWALHKLILPGIRLGKGKRRCLLDIHKISLQEGPLLQALLNSPRKISLENPTPLLGTTCSAWLWSAARPFLIVVCQTMSSWKTHLSPPVNLLKSIQLLQSNN